MVDPVIGAAALTVLGGLMSGMMQRNDAKSAAKSAAREAEKNRQAALEKEARDRVAQAQQNQLGTARAMGQGEQDALGQLITALARTAR